MTTKSTDLAMQTAFEDKYQRDWNDPASDDMKAVWANAWNAASIHAMECKAQSVVYSEEKIANF